VVIRHRNILLAAIVLCPAGLRAGDWPQFLGPDASGISPETHLASSWPAGGPRVVWTAAMGHGWAGAVVRDGELYVLDRDEDRALDILRCLDLQTGRQKWSFPYESRGKFFSHSGSRGLPTVDEKHVYVVGTFGQFHCIDRATHKPVWSHHLVADFPGTGPDSLYAPPGNRNVDANSHQPCNPAWGQTQTPVLYKDTVLVAPQTDTVGVAAYDKATGAPRWKSPYVGRNWFGQSTGRLTRLGGVDQFVLAANAHPPGTPPAVISGVEAATGKLLWQIVTWRTYKIPIPMPVNIGGDRLFITGGYGIGCFSLHVLRDGEGWRAEYGFRSNDIASHTHTPIFYKGYIYSQSLNPHFVSNRNGLVCMDADGKVQWKTGPKLTFNDGSLICADGKCFVMDGSTGELYLIEATHTGYHELARAKVLAAKGKTAWAPMALSDGKLIVRDLTEMKCLDVSAAGGT
jgi:outer membrane protein assembly factor BamB